MIGFLALLLINAVLFVASSLLVPKPHFDDAIPDDPKGPRSQEGDVIPVVFGTARIPANVTAFTAPQAVSETQKVKTGVFSSSTVTTGYSYAAFLQAVLCHGPIDALLDIIFQQSKSLSDGSTDTIYEPTEVDDGEGGTTTVYAPVTTDINYTSPLLPILTDGAVGGKLITVAAPDLFGGYQHGGGVSGPVRIHWGVAGQTADPTLDELFQQALSEDTGSSGDGVLTHFVPTYEKIAHVVLGVSDGADFQRFNFGESGQVPPLYFVVRRCPSNLGLAAAITNIAGGSNPAEVVYECLINTVWGAAVPTNQIDQASFIAAANTLAAEGFGFNLSLTSSQPLDTIVTEVMRYIDGQLQQHPITGLLELTLNRADYVAADLPLVDESNATEPNLTRPSWTSLINEVRVMYTRVVSGLFKQVPTQPIQDLAAQRNFGSTNAATVQFPAVTDVLLANSLGARSLRVMSTPLAQLTFKTSRVAADFKIGRPFRYSWALHGIVEHIFRVTEVDYGNLVTGQISVTAVEDIFGLEQPFYSLTVDDTRPKQTYGVLGQVSVLPVVTSDGITGFLALNVSGGNGRVTAVQFQEQSGNGVPSAFHNNTDPAAVRTSVALDSKHTSVIRWQVLGTLPDGTVGELRAGEVEYPVAARPARPALSYTLDGGTGEVTALVDVDSDAKYIRIAASTFGVPTLADVLATANIAVPSGATRVTVASVLTLAPDQHGYLSAVALDAAGNPSELASINLYFPDAANDPAITLVRNDPSLTGQLCDVSFRVTSPLSLGGTLKVWLNHDAVANPAYSDAPDGTIVLSATPANPGPADVFNKTSGGTGLLLHSIVTHPTKGKLIFAEFIDGSGRSSGQQSFLINGTGGPVNNDGSLKPGSILNAEQFAAGLAPVEVYAEPLPLTRPVGTVALDTTILKLVKWNGTAWINIVNTTDLSGTISAAQLAVDSVTAGAIAAGAVTTTALAAGAVTAVKISVLSLSSLSSDMGIVVSGKFQNAVTSPSTVIDMGATGTQAVISHLDGVGATLFALYANGTAYFAGDVEWGGVVHTPNTASGYGITDVLTSTGAATGLVPLGSGTGIWGWDHITFSSISGSLDWTHITGHPTTVAGYGITDALTTTGAHTWIGTQTFSSEVMGSFGFAATGGVGFVDTSGSGFSIPSGGGVFSGDGSGLINVSASFAASVPWTGLSGSAASLTPTFSSLTLSCNHTAIAVPFSVTDDVGYGIYVAAQNTLNFNYGQNADTAGYINYCGYAGGGTHYRDLLIANGKNVAIASFIGSTGRFGIGTLSPTAALDVRGSGVFTGGVSALSLGGDGSAITNINPANITFSGMIAGQVLKATSPTLAGFDYVNFSEIVVSPGSIAWSKIIPPGTTMSSYGITDGLTTTGPHTWSGTQTFTNGVSSGFTVTCTGGSGFVDTSGSGFSIPSGGGTFSGDGSNLSGSPSFSLLSAASLHVNYTYPGVSIPFFVNDASGYGIYVSGENTLNFNYGQTGTSAGYINWVGYSGGTTQFRDLNIGNGKGSVIASFTGSTGAFTSSGIISAAGYVDGSGNALAAIVGSTNAPTTTTGYASGTLWIQHA